MSIFRLLNIQGLFIVLCLVTGLTTILPSALPQAATDAGVAWILRIDGAIGPATADYVVRNLEHASQQGVRLVVLQMDTPGGLDFAMRDMVQAIIASPVPVISYVWPSGARAASAGTYLLYASHVAAMAPGTNLGAATPVQIGAQLKAEVQPASDSSVESTTPPNRAHTDPAETPAFFSDQQQDSSDGDTMKAKMVNDAEAYLRSLAELHGRNAEWAAAAVRNSASLPAHEALEKGVIDLIAPDLDSLLQQSDGREIKLNGQAHTLHTAGLIRNQVVPDWRNRLLSILTDPNVAYILMLIGIYGLFFEFANPGAVIPGVLGGICLLLALFAFQILPVNYAGLALLLLGVAFMVSEAFLPSFGALGIGGAVAFIIGSIMLLDTDIPGFGISRSLIFTVGIVNALFFFWVISHFLNLQRKPSTLGSQAMLGLTGKCLVAEEGGIQVFVHGEIWQAQSHNVIKMGDSVRVTGIEGLSLTVEPVMPPDEMGVILK